MVSTLQTGTVLPAPLGAMLPVAPLPVAGAKVGFV